MLETGLFAIVILILFLPITSRCVEKNLELFFLTMGVLSITFSHLWGHEPVWSTHLLREALSEPIMITVAVVVVGLLLHYFNSAMMGCIVRIEHALGPKIFYFFLITLLGLVSSVITAIMSAIILSEIVGSLHLSKKSKTKIVVLGCFSIGFGAALTPLGEPLSTICIAKLKGEPYNADFFFLLRMYEPGICFTR